MNAGKLNKKAALEKALEKPDGGGGFEKEEWSKIADPWVNIRPLKEEELYRAAKLGRKTTHVITARFREDLAGPGKFRFIHKQRVFNIHTAFDPTEQKKELRCLCSEDK